MIENSNAADRLRAWSVMLATIGTIAFNALSASGYLNGVTPKAISDKYPTVVTPAGYAFTIWSLIYLGLIAFSIYQMMASNLAKFRRLRTIYILSCVFNCGWIFFWHRDMIAVCLGMIVALLATVLALTIGTQRSASPVEAVFTKLPFGIYAGWVTAATLVNLVVLLVWARVDISQSSWNIIGVACVAAGTIAAVAVRFIWRNFLYPLSIAWAAAAIAINQQGNTTMIVASVVSVIVCLLLSMSFVIDLNGSSYE